MSKYGAAIRASAPSDAPLASRPFLSDGSLVGLYRPDGGAFLQRRLCLFSLIIGISPLLVMIYFAVQPPIPPSKIEFLEEILPFWTKTNVAEAKLFSANENIRCCTFSVDSRNEHCSLLKQAPVGASIARPPCVICQQHRATTGRPYGDNRKAEKQPLLR